MLERNEFAVFETTVSFAASVAARAEVLRADVSRILANGHYEQVNIIGHSMGGLDSRHLILMDERRGKVAGLVTIGTPHRGTSFAEWGLQNLNAANDLIDLLRLAKLDLSGLRDLTTASCQQFNQQVEADEAENGHQQLERVFTPLQPSWRIIDERQGPNGGPVPVSSQRWQAALTSRKGVKRVDQREVPVAADHPNELGRWHPWVDPAETPQTYEAKIQRMYLDIAQAPKRQGLYRRYRAQ